MNSPADAADRSVAPAASLAPILAVNFVGTLGFSIVLPFLVYVVHRWGGNALIYGVMGATYSACQLIGAPILGRWSDRFGRRTVLLLSQLGTLASWAIFLVAFFVPEAVLATSDTELLGKFTLTLPLLLLFIARAADGLTGGNVSVANAYLADVTPPANRKEAFGRMAASSNLGFVVGPALAGVLGATVLGEILPVTCALIVSAIAAGLIVWKLKESHPCVLTRDPDQAIGHKVLGQAHKECFRLHQAKRLPFRDMLALPHLSRVLCAYFFVMLGFNVFYIGFPVYASMALQWSVLQTGMFFAVLSLAMVVAQGPVLRWASRRGSDRALIWVGSALLAVSFTLFASANAAVIYGGALLMALGNGLLWPSVLAVLSKVAGDEHQGAVQGVASSIGAFASIVGLLVGGMIYGALEHQVFFLAAACLAIVLVVSIGLRVPVSIDPQGEPGA